MYICYIMRGKYNEYCQIPDEAPLKPLLKLRGTNLSALKLIPYRNMPLKVIVKTRSAQL